MMDIIDTVDDWALSWLCWLWTWPLVVYLCLLCVLVGLMVSQIVSEFFIVIFPRLSTSELIPHKC